MAEILLVEDNLNLAAIVVRELEASNLSVVHAAGGQAALRELAVKPYDAVILDWMLPDLDGLEVLRRMQAAYQNVPVLMLTARTDEVDRVIGLEVGADDYLTKPFGMRELVARLHALLRRAAKTHTPGFTSPGAQGALNWGAVSIEPDNRRVLVDGKVVNLTPHEYGLLELLVRHPHRIFNRAYLMETIWEVDYIPGDRSVDNAVQRLRKKLHPYKDAIEAVWGIGYRLRSSG